MDLSEERHWGNVVHCRTRDKEWLHVPFSPLPHHSSTEPRLPSFTQAERYHSTGATGVSSQMPQLSTFLLAELHDC